MPKPRIFSSPAYQVLMLTWLLAAAYYFSRFNYSPVIPLIKADLAITNANAGLLMAFFFLSYTLFQLPSGYLGDRFGPRKTLTFGALVAVVGNIIFSQGSHFAVLALGQFVNGMGQAVGWSSAIKLVVSWFPRQQRGTALGLFITCVTAGSSIGILLAGTIGERFGWRLAFVLPPLFLALISAIFWCLVRDTPQDKGLPAFDDEIELERTISSDQRSGVIMVLSHRKLWVVAAVYFCFVYVQFGCLVWIPAFLSEGYGIAVERASTLASLVLLPGVFASPLGGYFSDRFFGGRRKPLIFIGMGILSASCLLLSLGLNIVLAGIVLAVVGLMILMPDVLLAALPADFLSRKLTATAMGFLATFTSASGIITTPVSGKLVDMFQSYQPLFLSFAAMALLGMLITLFISEN